jgi:uncharacterized protein YgiM (DUF1202 family)
MTARRLLISAGLFLSFTALLSTARAEDPNAAPDVENSKYQFLGTVNSNAVYVRTGPSENYYAAVKLDKGAQVTVVGIKFDWLKILPPEGSFSYVAKAYVEKRGDGTIGRVTKPDLNVRAGSTLTAMKTQVQTKLNENDDVEIIGEQDEYFKIKPPAGAYLYVNKQFVDPGKALNATEVAVKPEEDRTAAGPTTHPTGDVAIAATQPAVEVAMATTQAVDPAAEAQYDKLEAQYLALPGKPLDEQPLTEMLAGYQALAKGEKIPDSMRRMADFRVGVLKSRLVAKEQLATVRKNQEENVRKQEALKAEQQELETRLAQSRVILYTAVGTLRASSLQAGGQTLYRLTDPANGRTIVYIRTNDPKLSGMLGQFIGVKGEVIADPQLSLNAINPTTFAVVDPNMVNSTVAAQIVPPSLIPRNVTASVGN